MPSSLNVHITRGFEQLALGQLDAAVTTAYQLIDLGPLSSDARGHAAYFLHGAGRQAEALAAQSAAEAQIPGDYFLMWTRVAIDTKSDTARARAKEMVERIPVPQSRVLYAWTLAASDRHAEAWTALKELHALQVTEYVWPTGLAMVYATLGDRDHALEWLERAYDDRAGGLIMLARLPCFDWLHDDPRFSALVRAMGLSVIKAGSTAPTSSRH